MRARWQWGAGQTRGKAKRRRERRRGSAYWRRVYAQAKPEGRAGLARRGDGVKSVAGAEIDFAIGDGGRGVDAGVEVVDGENFPIAGSFEDDDFAVFAGQ